MFDFTIHGAMIYDGTGGEPFRADVGIEGDRIARIGALSSGHTSIHAEDLAVAPGFIDVHTHDDVAVIEQPDMLCKVMGGVTTSIVGNCGMGCVPLSTVEKVAGIFQADSTFPLYGRFAQYFEHIENYPPSINVGVLAGFGTLRESVMGAGTGDPTADQMRLMKGTLAEGLEVGILGMSTGLIYEPDIRASKDEIVELAETMRDTGALYTTHLRDEGVRLLQSVEEAIDIGTGAGVPIQISHHKAAGESARGLVLDSLRKIEEAQSGGVDIHADQYPYTAGSTILSALVPKIDSGDYAVGDIAIASAPLHPAWVGKSLTDLSTVLGVRESSIVRELLRQEPNIGVVAHIMSEDDVRIVMRHSSTMIGSDGIPIKNARPHPRLYGTFARVLGHYARDLGLFSMQAGIYKMTGLPAWKFGLKDRGAIKEGMFADLVVFDPLSIIDTGTYDNSERFPDGITHVFVNGIHTVKEGIHTGARAGASIRRGKT